MSGYVSQPNPCSSNSCYSSQTPVSSPVSCRSGSCGGSVSSPVSCRTGACSSSSSSGSTTVIVVQQSPSHSSSQTSHNPSGYPNCQCDYLFNTHGQGNCNGAGARTHTNDRYNGSCSCSRFCSCSFNTFGKLNKSVWSIYVMEHECKTFCAYLASLSFCSSQQHASMRKLLPATFTFQRFPKSY